MVGTPIAGRSAPARRRERGSACTRRSGATPASPIALIHGKRVVVVLPAYNAAKTLERTYRAIPRDVVDEVVLVDDASHDETVAEAHRLGIPTCVHAENRGYGANQKTCYAEALRRGADVVVMLHPDYQYEPRLAGTMAALVASDIYDVVLGSRVLGISALKSGMPPWKYVSNRALTFVENILLGRKLSEYHTGYRAFSRQVIERLPLLENSDDFVFDNQMLAQVVHFGFRIGEISCPCRYEPESSSINFRRSVKYGFGVLGTAVLYRLARWGIVRPSIFSDGGRRVETTGAPTATGVASRGPTIPEPG